MTAPPSPMPTVAAETPCAGCEEAVGSVGSGRPYTIQGRLEVLCEGCYNDAMPLATKFHEEHGVWPTTDQVLNWLHKKDEAEVPESERLPVEGEPAEANPAPELPPAPQADDDWPSEIPVAENPEGPAAEYHHHRQIPPRVFEKDSFRTVPISHSDYEGRYKVEGAKAIVGRVKKSYRAKYGREGVRTPHRAWAIQSILTPKKARMAPTREEKARENPKRLGRYDVWHLRAGENPGKPPVPKEIIGASPADMTPEQRTMAVDWLSKLPLKELRRRQDITNSQIGQAHRQRSSEGLRQLRAQEDILTDAVMKREFPGAGENPRATYGQDPSRLTIAQLEREIQVHKKTVAGGQVGTPNVHVRLADLERELALRAGENPVTKKEAAAIAEFGEHTAQDERRKHELVAHQGDDRGYVTAAFAAAQDAHRRVLFRAISNPEEAGTCTDCTQMAVVRCTACESGYCTTCCEVHRPMHAGVTANPPPAELADAEGHFREALRILKRKATANPDMMKCVDCGKAMNPIERLMGPVCGACVRKKHKAAAGENPNMLRRAPLTGGRGGKPFHQEFCGRCGCGRGAHSPGGSGGTYCMACGGEKCPAFTSPVASTAGANPTKPVATAKAESKRSAGSRARVLPTTSVKGGHSVFLDGKRFGKGKAKRIARKVAELHRAKGYLARVVPVKGGFEAFLGLHKVERVSMRSKPGKGTKVERAVRRAKRPAKVHKVRVKTREKRSSGFKDALKPSGAKLTIESEKTLTPPTEPSEAELASLVDEAAEAQSASTAEAAEPTEQELADLAKGA